MSTNKAGLLPLSGAHRLTDTEITDLDRERSCTVHMLGQVEQLLASLNGHLNGNQRLLDVGCGFGGLPAAIGGYLNIEEIYGVDVDPAVLSEATAKGVRAARCEVGREPLPYPTEHFDLVTSFGMLDYLPHYDDALREIFRITKPGVTSSCRFPT
jgi:ubiquinone/menaquinone biosynthesis C-methylase UbiE